MIEEKPHIKYLYDLKHRNDSLKNNGSDYKKTLFKHIFSNVLFGNTKMQYFLPLLQENVIWMIDSTLLIRNWWNVTVDKYYNNHNN